MKSGACYFHSCRCASFTRNSDRCDGVTGFVEGVVISVELVTGVLLSSVMDGFVLPSVAGGTVVLVTSTVADALPSLVIPLL
jgi:hypothetical protein